MHARPARQQARAHVGRLTGIFNATSARIPTYHPLEHRLGRHRHAQTTTWGPTSRVHITGNSVTFEQF